MQHLDEGIIHSWLDGALSADEAARVKAHVDECPQCAAAVAEARGFIAASSRILTALDHVPKGVVPVDARAKPRNWVPWRAAAAVLVVALGSFAVLRDRMGTQRSVFEVAPPSAPNPTAKVLIKPQREQSDQPPARTANPLAFGKIDTQVALGRERASAQAAVSQPPAAVADVRPEPRADNAPPQNIGAATMKVAVEPLSGRVAGVASSVRVSGVAMSDTAVASTPIRVVGTPRVFGEKRTLYEIAPGDTVLLAEVLNFQLSSVVVTAAGTTRVAQPAPSPSAPPSVGTLNGVTTLTWIDPASKSTMKLSGRHSPAELTEIRRRIEQLRAAEAAAKKKP